MIRGRGIFGVVVPRSGGREHGITRWRNVFARSDDLGRTRRRAVVPRKGDSTGLSSFVGNLIAMSDLRELAGPRQTVVIGVAGTDGRSLPVERNA
jgi:hypothetical protein